MRLWQTQVDIEMSERERERLYIQSCIDNLCCSKLIIPPETVVSKQRRTVSSPRRRIISNVLPPATEDSPGARPLVVVGNNKSGNSDCAAILAGFRRHLNPAQVVNLGESNMEEALEWCSLVKPRQCIVLACGGDGTVR